MGVSVLKNKNKNTHIQKRRLLDTESGAKMVEKTNEDMINYCSNKTKKKKKKYKDEVEC